MGEQLSPDMSEENNNIDATFSNKEEAEKFWEESKKTPENPDNWRNRDQDS